MRPMGRQILPAIACISLSLPLLSARHRPLDEHAPPRHPLSMCIRNSPPFFRGGRCRGGCAKCKFMIMRFLSNVNVKKSTTFFALYKQRRQQQQLKDIKKKINKKRRPKAYWAVGRTHYY